MDHLWQSKNLQQLSRIRLIYTYILQKFIRKLTARIHCNTMCAQTRDSVNYLCNHCVKTVRIRSYSGPHFSCIFPHSDFGIQCKCGKMQENNFQYGLFLRSEYQTEMHPWGYSRCFGILLIVYCNSNRYLVVPVVDLMYGKSTV